MEFESKNSVQNWNKTNVLKKYLKKTLFVNKTYYKMPYLKHHS